MKRFVSPKQAAERLPVTEHFIRQLIASGNCPGFYVGSHYMVDTERLQERIEAAAESNGHLSLSGRVHHESKLETR